MSGCCSWVGGCRWGNSGMDRGGWIFFLGKCGWVGVDGDIFWVGEDGYTFIMVGWR